MLGWQTGTSQGVVIRLLSARSGKSGPVDQEKHGEEDVRLSTVRYEEMRQAYLDGERCALPAAQHLPSVRHFFSL